MLLMVNTGHQRQFIPIDSCAQLPALIQKQNEHSKTGNMPSLATDMHGNETASERESEREIGR